MAEFTVRFKIDLCCFKTELYSFITLLCLSNAITTKFSASKRELPKHKSKRPTRSWLSSGILTKTLTTGTRRLRGSEKYLRPTKTSRTPRNAKSTIHTASMGPKPPRFTTSTLTTHRIFSRNSVTTTSSTTTPFLAASSARSRATAASSAVSALEKVCSTTTTFLELASRAAFQAAASAVEDLGEAARSQ